MRGVTVIFVLFAVSIQLLQAQVRARKSSYQILGKWRMDCYKIRTGFKVTKTHPEVALEFRRDGTFSMVVEGKERKGNWRLAHKLVEVGAEPTTYFEEVLLDFSEKEALGISPTSDLLINVGRRRMQFVAADAEKQTEILFRANF
jgi:hypothetical protein